MCYCCQNQVQLLAAQRPLRGRFGGKESLLYFGCQQLGEMVDRHLPKCDSLPPLIVGESFYRRREGATCRKSHLSVILTLVIGGLTSVILIVLSTTNLQFQALFCFHFLDAKFRRCGSFMSCLQSGHHAVNFFHLAGVSVSTRQFTGYGSEFYLQSLRKNKGPWPCLMTKLLLSGLPWWFSFIFSLLWLNLLLF